MPDSTGGRQLANSPTDVTKTENTGKASGTHSQFAVTQSAIDDGPKFALASNSKPKSCCSRSLSNWDQTGWLVVELPASPQIKPLGVRCARSQRTIKSIQTD